MVTSPYEWKSFDWDEKTQKKQTNKKTIPFPKIAYIADFPPRKRDFIVVVPYFHIQMIALENLRCIGIFPLLFSPVTFTVDHYHTYSYKNSKIIHKYFLSLSFGVFLIKKN